MFIPELAVGLCRIVLDTLLKYRAVDMSSRPPMMSMVIVSAWMPMMALMIVIALKIINAFKPMIV
jgi:hypothetical protein